MARENFKLVYNKTVNDNNLNGSLSGIPSAEDKEIALSNIKGAKLIYEAKDEGNNRVIKASLKNIPTKEDKEVMKVADLVSVEVIPADEVKPAPAADKEEELAA